MIEPQKKKEIRNQIEYIREFLEDHQKKLIRVRNITGRTETVGNHA